MRSLVCVLAVAALMVALAPLHSLQAQATKTQPGTAAKGTTPAASPAEVLATVNGQSITRGEVVNILNRLPLRPGTTQSDAYEIALNVVVNTKLLLQFLKAQKVQVTQADVDAARKKIEDELKTNNRNLPSELAANNSSIEELNKQIAEGMLWEKYRLTQATDAALKKYVVDNQDFFNRTQVRASHILVKADPDAPAADKEKARKKLVDIKAQIEKGQINFADAANKFSEDDGNQMTPSGGDLGYFLRKNQYIEKFSAAAFAMKKGMISDPVETEFGFHLIQVTDRREGTPVDFEKAKPEIVDLYTSELQEKIVEAERTKAKIDVKPMPRDLFPAAPVEPTAPTTKPAAPAAPATKPAAKGAGSPR